jgi:anti-sigma B factor antagonist
LQSTAPPASDFNGLGQIGTKIATADGMMEIIRREANGVAVLDVTGEVDLYNAGELKDALQTILQAGQNRMVLRLDNVPYMDSTGIGVLLSTAPLARKAGGDLKIAGISAGVMKVFQITNLTKFFQIHTDEDAAIQAFV